MANTTKKLKGKRGAFFLGLAVGLLFFWVPLEHSFEHFRFDSLPWKQPQKLGAFPIPTTSPIIEHKGFTVAYDGKTKNALWVYQRLSADLLAKEADRKSSTFREDPLLPAQIRSTSQDYEGSGYDRGHLAPAANNASSKESLDESFYLSNIAPQNPEFNRGYWKQVENHLRRLLKDYETLHIFTGPLYLSQKEKGGRYVKYEVIGPHEVAVPTHFFVLFFTEKKAGEFLAKGYILPNRAIDSNISLEKFAATVEKIERASGVIFSKMMNL